jgi:hypothetical protein
LENIIIRAYIRKNCGQIKKINEKLKKKKKTKREKGRIGMLLAGAKSAGKKNYIVTKEFSPKIIIMIQKLFSQIKETQKKKERKKKLVVVGYYIDRLNRPIARQIQKEI